MIPIQQLWRHLIPPPQLVPGAIRNPDFIFPKGRGFKMASLNITSLLKHIDELRIVLDGQPIDILAIECFHMTSRRPYWCPKTMKRRPCWCPKRVLWELNSFLMQTLSFVPVNLHRC